MSKEKREYILRRAQLMEENIRELLPVLSRGWPEVQTICLVNLLRATLKAWMCAVNTVEGAEALAQFREQTAQMAEEMIVKLIREFNPAEIEAKVGNDLFNAIVGDKK